LHVARIAEGVVIALYSGAQGFDPKVTANAGVFVKGDLLFKILSNILAG
jgi:hypothetical protein